jgi:hypothetical protein
VDIHWSKEKGQTNTTTSNGGEMTNRIGTTIPREIIRPHIQGFLEEFDQESLASLSGVSIRRIYEINTMDGWCMINTADKLFCGMGKPELWWTDEELGAYYRGDKVAA